MKDYLNWAISQKAFSDAIRTSWANYLPHWGDFTYNVSIPGYDADNNRRIFRFQVEQFFCESFCTATGLDYGFALRQKENAAKVHDLLDGNRRYTSCVYDKLAAFVLNHPEKAVVIFADSIKDDWTDLSYKHFSYLIDLLKENNILYLEMASLCDLIEIKAPHIVIVELISSNDSMIFNCERVLKSCSNLTPSITYISLLKEYSRDEMIEVIEDEKRGQLQNTQIKQNPSSINQVESLVPEYKYLCEAIHRPKPESKQIKSTLDSNDISCFYHFTDRRNLDSIKRYGGLYSWHFCEKHNIKISFPGGNSDSRTNDRRHGLEDYVRVSFCEDHPMSWRLQQCGYDLVLLKIKVDVALAESTLFSDINAADSSHHHGGTLNDLKMVDFAATKAHYITASSPIFKKHQAEVLVKSFLPIEYIVNIDNPDMI